MDKEEECFKIAVKDNGIGIPPDKLETIFERFVQIDGSSSRKYEGTGIGLSLTKNIIKIMDGNLAVASRPGQGSVFTITLPFGKKEGTDSKESSEKIRPTGSCVTAEFMHNTEPYLRHTQIIDHQKKINRKKLLIV